MANPDHVRILRAGVEAWNSWRSSHNHVRPDLAVVDFSDADLRTANLGFALLRGASLAKANLRHADLRGANISESTLAQADLAGSRLADATLAGADLTEADLRNADLFRADLEGAVLINADLSGTNLQKTIFQDTKVDGADLSQARMLSTIMANIDLSAARGLETVSHIGASSLGVDTILRSRGKIPRVFLRSAGVPESLLDYGLDSAAEPTLYYSSFISYSRHDSPFARRLYGELQSRGIRCWLDEHDLKMGDRILDVVSDAIRLHDKILLCCSEESLTSWWVTDEIRSALERERREKRDIIIPLILDSYLLEGWQDGLASDLRSRLAADFTGWEHDNAKFEEQFERVVKALQTEVGANERAPESKQ